VIVLATETTESTGHQGSSATDCTDDADRYGELDSSETVLIDF
jgi:hypothetical protein